METQKDTAPRKEVYDPLENLALKPILLKNLQNYGALQPSIVQENIVELLLNGRDVLVQAPLTTGRILSTLIPAIQIIDENVKGCQVLILLPTRELCQQIIYIINELTKEMNIKAAQIIGGIRPPEIRKTLEEKPHIIIGTPGRVYDSIQRDWLELRGLELMILGEADEMLGRGFQDQIQDILKFVPMDVQMGIFSPTISYETEKLVEDCLREPVKIMQKEKYVDMRHVEHFKVSVRDVKEMNDFLLKFYDEIGKRHSVIYCRTVEKMWELVKMLRGKGFYVAGIDFSMTESERCRIIREFLGSSDQILVSVSSSFFDEIGCTPSTIPLVIHYDLPLKKEHYQENFGILRRFSKRQTAVNLVTPSSLQDLEEIEKFYSIKMKEVPENLSLIFEDQFLNKKHIVFFPV